MNLATVSITFQHPNATIAALEATWMQERIQLLLNQRYTVVSDCAGAILQARFNSQLVTEGVQLTSEVRSPGKAPSVYNNMTEEEKRIAHNIQVRRMMDDGA